MNEPSMNDGAEMAELREASAEMRRTTTLLLAAGIIVSVIVTAFFGIQIRRDTKDIQNSRDLVAQAVEANKKQSEAAGAFIGKLVDFAKTHPEMTVILTKYGVRPGEPGTTAPKK